MKLDFGEKNLFQLIKEAITYLKQEGLIETIAHTFLILKRAIGIYVPVEDEIEYLPYDSRYENNQDFSERKTDVKPLAFFLPQFHEIPENDAWWGKGFTEWVNTEKAIPQFKGHYQPRRPHIDIGFYDLSNIETLKKQVQLAKQHGIYGFCFYYYWFSGKRLLEKPVNMFLQHQEISMPFCLCWANENWTRTWSGNQKDVMMAQEYAADDPYRFMDDIKPYILDSRYIRVDGKPILIVYNAGEIPDCVKTFEGWRKRARENGIGEILIWTCRTANHTAEEMQIVKEIDAEVEFPPHNFWKYKEIAIKDFNLNGKSAFIYNYQKLVKLILRLIKENKNEKIPVYRTCMMGWDNACRRSIEWTTYYGYSLKAFYEWIGAIVSEARKKFGEEERFFFINAWNEWGEGTYLEPDEKYGYANINTLSKAIFDIPFEKRIKMTSLIETKYLAELDGSPKIAVQCHIFYPELAEEIVQNVNKIPYPYDLFISTNTEEKKRLLEDVFRKNSTANAVAVDIYDNKGRDVAPFLFQIGECYDKYRYICHIHSKKTSNAEYGDGWREYLYKHLFGTSKNLEAIFNLFEEDKTIGLIYPDTYPVLKTQEEWGGNRSGCESLLERLGISCMLNHEIEFPVGNMFWMRASAVKDILGYCWRSEDFPKEEGQVNLTISHQIERLWKVVAEAKGYRTQLIYNNTPKTHSVAYEDSRIALFVHYHADGKIDSSDISYLKSLKEICGKVVFITNCGRLHQRQKEKIAGITEWIIERKNEGYDFGAWQDAIRQIGYEKISKCKEVILANNSCYQPLFCLSDIFSEMEEQQCDLWAMTEFPYLQDGRFIGKKEIKRHLQSYFIVFKNKILQSASFREYWESVGSYNSMIEVVANCESEMTDFFEQRGFISKAYVREGEMLCKALQSFAVPFEFPYQMLLMGNPLVKKKSDLTIYAEERNLVKDIREDFI